MPVSFKVIVAGSSGGYAGPGKACSGYLLEHENHTLALDLGSGALGNLLKYTGADTLDGLVISHLHYDHYMDIYGLLTARRFGEEQLPPLPLLAPPGAAKHIGIVIHSDSRELFMECLDVTETVTGEEMKFCGFSINAKPAKHIKNSFIFRISAGSRTLCYSGDTDRCDALVEQAGGADLFICEATFTSEVPLKLPGHLSAKEAGEIASQAGVGRLLLTHLWPTLSGEQAIEDAQAAYCGPVDLAVEGLTLYVGPYPVAAT
jgi:ribonuclease BN (tRNA processing enzyme)